MSSQKHNSLDLTHAPVQVWLVKVPKYIASRWENMPGDTDVGRLRITNNASTGNSSQQRSQISLSLSEGVMALTEGGKENIPKEYRLDASTINQQTLGVFSRQLDEVGDGTDPIMIEKTAFVGGICRRLECKPRVDSSYMKLKLESIRKAAVPARTTKQLNKIVQNYKPISNHVNNIQYEEKKKAEGKKMRDDKDVVLEMLFAAFEKHQFYSLKDLVKKTRQPVVYLKEILKEVCNYNTRQPHKNMWELKPEYRHYKEPEPSEETN